MYKLAVKTIKICSVITLIALVPITNFAIAKRAEARRYVTSAGADYCYYRGHAHKNMKRKNMKFYQTAETCGKTLKS